MERTELHTLVITPITLINLNDLDNMRALSAIALVASGALLGTSTARTNDTSILGDASNGRCGWIITAFAGSDCNGDQHDSTIIIDGQCSRVTPGEEVWKSWSATANPC
ncbi:hypothetical protein F5Y06DRAFT_300686 [Hypoxylon sp. FL0890]|nr:hypothetical protein F5Y06DRAFT_300686 [Hypoxylon sp. FL0890]